MERIESIDFHFSNESIVAEMETRAVVAKTAIKRFFKAIEYHGMAEKFPRWNAERLIEKFYADKSDDNDYIYCDEDGFMRISHFTIKDKTWWYLYLAVK